MILYKYRSLTNFERILDITLNQRLYCSTYDKLNDPFEGIFATTLFPHRSYKPTGAGKENVQMPPIVASKRSALMRLAKLRRRQNTTHTYKKVEELFGGKIDEIKICSLSSDLKDVRLWSYYAHGHRGVVFEIDLSGLEERNGSKIIHPVIYSEKLPWGLLPGEKRITLLGVEESGPIKPQDVLSRKTKHWIFESEYRIIHESKYLAEGKYFDIKGRIKAIYLGTRTSDIYPNEVKLLNKIVPGEIPIYTTKINEKTIDVERGESIPERNISP